MNNYFNKNYYLRDYIKLLKILAIIAIIFPSNLFAEESLVTELEHLLSSSSMTNRLLYLFILITVLSLAPSILIMVTSFIRISIVLSILRSALGLQQTPPNQVIVSLSLFLTLFIMTPTFNESYTKGINPMIEEKITVEDALPIIANPFKVFMIHNTNEKDLNLFISIAKLEIPEKNINLPLQVVIPSFMISELKRGFEIGFLVFLPFVIIDIVVASILMAMGMMMMPPVMISMPFKIIFFVLIDGWYLLCGSLIQSFSI